MPFTYLTPSEKQTVRWYMRRILKDQCTSSFMNRDLLDYIEANTLLRVEHWPGYHVTLTARGAQFLNEQDEEE